MWSYRKLSLHTCTFVVFFVIMGFAQTYAAGKGDPYVALSVLHTPKTPAPDFTPPLSQSYRIRGHPVTFLIDRQGFLVGQVLGERDWSSPEAKTLITTLLQEHP